MRSYLQSQSQKAVEEWRRYRIQFNDNTQGYSDVARTRRIIDFFLGYVCSYTTVSWELIPANMMKQQRAPVAKMRQVWSHWIDTFLTPRKDTVAARNDCVAFMEWYPDDPNHSLSSCWNASATNSDTRFQIQRHSMRRSKIGRQCVREETHLYTSYDTTCFASGEALIKLHSKMSLR